MSVDSTAAPEPEPISLFLDLEPDTSTMGTDVWKSLNDEPKWLPSKYFYDARGSTLFDEICELDEYYPTRTETGILDNMMGELTRHVDDDIILLEYGSGSSLKTRMLIERLSRLKAYIPIDISRDHLLAAGARLKEQFQELRILPVCADYGQQIPFPWDDPMLGRLGPAARMVFFPGSTIGNFTRGEAVAFLRRMQSLLGRGGYLLIGVDLVKDISILEAAYNDSSGVTAAFNRNILAHINRRLGADFPVDAFDHRAFYDREHDRVEMNLVARAPMTVQLPQGSVSLSENEIIRTEYSHKYRPDMFADLAREGGFGVERVWIDDQRLFSVQLLRAE